MTAIITERHGNIGLIRLAGSVTNPLGPELIRELEQALEALEADSRGLILCGGEKFFSIGFDLPVLLKLDRDGMRDFYSGFNQTLLKLLTLPLPTLCCITGHAVAGGCILGLGCDFRIAASEKTKIGLNEIVIGVPVPLLADRLLRHIVGNRAATRMMYTGDFITAAEAETIGLVDETLAGEELENRGLEKIQRFAAASMPAFARIKANRVEEIASCFKRQFPASLEAFLDIWFSPETRELLFKAAEKF
ncbi:MAG: enoyl-CoA hydratase/isomerase family protein [Desulfohalobiaceae bacterium]|nr:enoyl-CoA hydratase/isomerase family protein [Desulfohalobiaceae bacterium]